MSVLFLPADFLAAVSEALPFPSVIHWARVSRAQRALYLGDECSVFPLGGLQFSRLTGRVQRNPTESAAVEWSSCISPDSLRTVDIDSVGDEPCPQSATMLFSKLVEQAARFPNLVEVTFMKSRSEEARQRARMKVPPPSPSLVAQLLHKAPNLECMHLWDIDRFCFVEGRDRWSDRDTQVFVNMLQSFGIRHEHLKQAQNAFPSFDTRVNMFANIAVDLRDDDDYLENPSFVIREYIRWKAQFFKSFPRLDPSLNHHLYVVSAQWLAIFRDHLVNEPPLCFDHLSIDLHRGDSLASGKALADILTTCCPRKIELRCDDQCEFQTLVALSRCRRTFESVEKLEFGMCLTHKEDWSNCAEAFARVLSRFTQLKELDLCTGAPCLTIGSGWNSTDTQIFCDKLPILASLERFSLTGDTGFSSAHDGVALAKVLLAKLPNVQRFRATLNDSAALLGFRLQLDNAVLRGDVLPSTLKGRFSICLHSWSQKCHDSKYDEESRLLDKIVMQTMKRRRGKRHKSGTKSSGTLLTRSAPSKHKK